MELGSDKIRLRSGSLMGRDTCICAIDYVAKRIGENLELLEEIAGNSDNIDYGEMIDVVTGPDEAITAFTSRGIKTCRSSSPISALGRVACASSSSNKTAIPQ